MTYSLSEKDILKGELEYSFLINYPSSHIPFARYERRICGSQMNYGKKDYYKTVPVCLSVLLCALAISIAYYSKYHFC